METTSKTLVLVHLSGMARHTTEASKFSIRLEWDFGSKGKIVQVNHICSGSIIWFFPGKRKQTWHVFWENMYIQMLRVYTKGKQERVEVLTIQGKQIEAPRAATKTQAPQMQSWGEMGTQKVEREKEMNSIMIDSKMKVLFCVEGRTKKARLFK